MAYTTINKSTDHFDIRTYAASGAGSISDVSFQPDFLWFKNRTVVGDHGLMDAVRGVNGIIHSNDANAEVTSNGTTNVTAFTSNGFTYGASSLIDTGSGTPCTWLWKANGTGSTNTNGSQNSTVSANTAAGFSIVKYTGTGANVTIGHGLGVAPKMIHIKGLGNANNWLTGGTNISSNWASSLHLNTTAGIDTYNYWQNYAPNTNVFYMTSDGAINQSGIDYIAYCFSDVQGYSKCGSYIGNANADGTFIYTGFSPAYVMLKRTDTAGERWNIKDNKRDGYNQTDPVLTADSTGAEYNDAQMDLLSNGFKIRTSAISTNASGGTYIYMAIAAAPLVGSNNVPANAR
tara:strand:- start:453 stop:1490 length:1038 start_codon:yes stop_codon:yes gene_type:complete